MEQPRQKTFEEKVRRIIPEGGDFSVFEDETNITAETFDFLKELLQSEGFTMHKEMNDTIRALGNRTLVVRREDPRKILELLSKGSYEVGFENERYSNCAEWNPQVDNIRGITNAYMEGMTNLNNVVTLIGFEKTSEQDIEKLGDATENFYGLERGNVRSFQGQISVDGVDMINLRVPGHLMSESELSEEEIGKIDEYLEAKESDEEANPVMIYRSFLRNVNEPTLH